MGEGDRPRTTTVVVLRLAMIESTKSKDAKDTNLPISVMICCASYLTKRVRVTVN